VLQRGKRIFRSPKHRARYVAVAVPPVPVSSYVDEIPPDGVVCRFQVPRDGQIGPLLLHAEVAPSGANRASMKVELIRSSGTVTREFQFNPGDNEIAGPVAVIKGDRVAVSIVKQSPTDVVTGIWVTLTVYPTLTHADVKKFGET